MAAFLRELDISRPAALVGGVVYAWQGDLLPFVFPGHYGYIATWPFYALAAWAALRAQRTRQESRAAKANESDCALHYVYALIAGASCGLMVGLQPDRGAIASLLIAALYLGPACMGRAPWGANLRQLALCAGVALLDRAGRVSRAFPRQHRRRHAGRHDQSRGDLQARDAVQPRPGRDADLSRARLFRLVQRQPDRPLLGLDRPDARLGDDPPGHAQPEPGHQHHRHGRLAPRADRRRSAAARRAAIFQSGGSTARTSANARGEIPILPDRQSSSGASCCSRAAWRWCSRGVITRRFIARSLRCR